MFLFIVEREIGKELEKGPGEMGGFARSERAVRGTLDGEVETLVTRQVDLFDFHGATPRCRARAFTAAVASCHSSRRFLLR